MRRLALDPLAVGAQEFPHEGGGGLFDEFPGAADLFDAAAMDGASALRVWWSMALPLVGPTAMAVASLTFLYFWGDYIDPLLMIKSPARYTLPIGLSILQQFDKTRWPLVMAATVIYALPSIGVFLASQRYFLSGRRMLWLS